MLPIYRNVWTISSKKESSSKGGKRCICLSGDLIRESQRILFNAIRIALKNKDASIQSVNGAIVNALRPFLYEKTEREPIIIPMILTPDK